MSIPTLQNISQQARAAWKFVFSFFKREWAIDDYPICLRFQAGTTIRPSSRLIQYPWVAQIINWEVMSGSGHTKREALEHLRKNLERQRSKGKRLPRPGQGLPIEFASQNRVDRHAELVGNFTKRVLDVDWVWISDESSLWDFHGDETNEVLNVRIRNVYGVDVSDISSGNLADIMDRISETPPSQTRGTSG